MSGGAVGRLRRLLQDAVVRIFLRSGILPFVLVASVIGFSLGAPRFLTVDNFTNVARQSTYLVIVSMGQMLTLLVRGVDMSVGATVALVSVCTAMAMSAVLGAYPNETELAIAAGMIAGLLAGVTIGSINGIGVAIFKVNPFIMTVAMLSIATGVALKLTGGMPVYGLPTEFGALFAYSAPFGIPSPVLVTAVLFVVLALVLYQTPLGRYIYAIGGDRVSSHLAGINTTAYTVVTYIMCSFVVAWAGVLLTARVSTGEATLGAVFVVQSISAVVIGGVSFFGGIGRLGNVVLGAVFVTLMTNGMDLNRVDSYVQQIVLGILLVTAVVMDQVRIRVLRRQHID